MKHSYYYGLNQKVFNFLIPKNKSLLYYGYYDRELILTLQPVYSICITEFKNLTNESSDNKIIHSSFEDYVPERTFDYIVLDIALGRSNDICLLLKNVVKACTEHTRVIIHQENYLWQPLLKTAAFLGLKNKEKTNNWLSVGDIHTYLKASGLEPTRSFNQNLCPVKIWFIGPLINFVSLVIPLFDFFKLDQFIVARALSQSDKSIKVNDPSLTICLTVRDEEANIEPIVESLPLICANQEILFVEGHSTDNTVNEIKRVQRLFPDKNIHLIHQDGTGQGDAIRQGFNKARGEIIILYEADGTSDPSDIQYFYTCIQNRNFEFIEGSRLSYPLVSESMPLVNKMGNIFFAKWFSLFLRQSTTDVLSGIKAIRKKDFELIYSTWGFLKTKDPFGDFELLYGSVRYGLKIGEIPIHYKPRNYGKSKTNVAKHGAYLLRMAWNGYFIFRNAKA